MPELVRLPSPINGDQELVAVRFDRDDPACLRADLEVPDLAMSCCFCLPMIVFRFDLDEPIPFLLKEAFDPADGYPVTPGLARERRYGIDHQHGGDHQYGHQYGDDLRERLHFVGSPVAVPVNVVLPHSVHLHEDASVSHASSTVFCDGPGSLDAMRPVWVNRTSAGPVISMAVEASPGVSEILAPAPSSGPPDRAAATPVRHHSFRSATARDRRDAGS